MEKKIFTWISWKICRGADQISRDDCRRIEKCAQFFITAGNVFGRVHERS